jgi:hypothetical protein
MVNSVFLRLQNFFASSPASSPTVAHPLSETPGSDKVKTAKYPSKYRPRQNKWYTRWPINVRVFYTEEENTISYLLNLTHGIQHRTDSWSTIRIKSCLYWLEYAEAVHHP